MDLFVHSSGPFLHSGGPFFVWGGSSEPREPLLATALYHTVSFTCSMSSMKYRRQWHKNGEGGYEGWNPPPPPPPPPILFLVESHLFLTPIFLKRVACFALEIRAPPSKNIFIRCWKVSICFLLKALYKACRDFYAATLRCDSMIMTSVTDTCVQSLLLQFFSAFSFLHPLTMTKAVRKYLN